MHCKGISGQKCLHWSHSHVGAQVPELGMLESLQTAPSKNCSLSLLVLSITLASGSGLSSSFFCTNASCSPRHECPVDCAEQGSFLSGIQHILISISGRLATSAVGLCPGSNSPHIFSSFSASCCPKTFLHPCSLANKALHCQSVSLQQLIQG